MNASIVDLRRSPGRILKAVEKREPVILSRRGKPVARITPIDEETKGNIKSHEAFGMWKNHDGLRVHDHVRNLRRGRVHDL